MPFSQPSGLGRELCSSGIGHAGFDTTAAGIEADFRKDLEYVVYYVTATADREVFNAAVQAFRSHFLSGPRRTYFQTKVDQPPRGEPSACIRPYVWSTEEEKPVRDLLNADGKLTAQWAREVAEYLEAARARADRSDPVFDGQHGWEKATMVEAEEGAGSTG